MITPYWDASPITYLLSNCVQLTYLHNKTIWNYTAQNTVCISGLRGPLFLSSNMLLKWIFSQGIVMTSWIPTNIMKFHSVHVSENLDFISWDTNEHTHTFILQYRPTPPFSHEDYSVYTKIIFGLNIGSIFMYNGLWNSQSVEPCIHVLRTEPSLLD